MFEHIPSKFWCNMRLQLHIHPEKTEGAVTLDKSMYLCSCISSGITIHEMTENLHSLHSVYILQQMYLPKVHLQIQRVNTLWL